MDTELKREIILDHYQNPRNKGLIDDDSYISVNMNNDSCIDEVNLMVKLNDGVIEDIKFDGESCAICTSSTSIMIETLIGKTIEEARNIYNNYFKMLNGEEYDSEVLGDSIVYDDISKQPNRQKCALLGWWGLEKAINDENCKK